MSSDRIAVYSLIGLAALLLTAVNTPAWWTLKAEAQAAWVQAIGSIIALGVAIGVPWRLDRIRRKEASIVKEHEANLLAAEIRQAMVDWRNNTIRLRKKLQNPSLTSLSAFESIQSDNKIKDELFSAFPQTHILGRCGVVITEANVYWRRLNVIREKLNRGAMEQPRERLLLSDARKLSLKLERSLDEAVFEISNRLDRIAPDDDFDASGING